MWTPVYSVYCIITLDSAYAEPLQARKTRRRRKLGTETEMIGPERIENADRERIERVGWCWIPEKYGEVGCHCWNRPNCEVCLYHWLQSLKGSLRSQLRKNMMVILVIVSEKNTPGWWGFRGHTKAYFFYKAWARGTSFWGCRKIGTKSAASPSFPHYIDITWPFHAMPRFQTLPFGLLLRVSLYLKRCKPKSR